MYVTQWCCASYVMVQQRYSVAT